MRVAVLMTGLTAYQAACFQRFSEHGNQLLLVHPPSLAFSDFRYRESDDAVRRVQWTDNETMPSAEELFTLLEEFDPDVVIMWSWDGDGYRAVMKRWRGRALRVIFTSNFWRATARQVVGLGIARWYVRPLFDAAWVPSERAEMFARRMGFPGSAIIRGANSADTELFASGPRDGAEIIGRRRFLFTGRLIWHKAPTELAEAYERYRSRVAEPWDLEVVGDGPLKDAFVGKPGVNWRGFLQPAELAELMRESSALVLPSHAEWYGVVLHEAAVAGLPIIATDGVGAVPHLLQDGFNGWTVPVGDLDELTEALVRMSSVDVDRMTAMSEGSRALGSRLSPAIWARNLHEELERRLPSFARR